MKSDHGSICSVTVSNENGDQLEKLIALELGPMATKGKAIKEIDGLRIQLLNEFRVCVGERVVDESEWYLRKTKSLVKLLALAPGHRVHRGELMDILWPEFEPGAAVNNLHKALHIARRTLEPDLPAKTASAYLHMAGEFVVLASAGSLRIDVETFRSAVQIARNSGNPDAYEAALNLYTGDLLPEDRYEDWVTRTREELEAIYVEVLLEFAELQERKGQTEAAIDTLRRLVARDPGNEEAQARLMRLLARSGLRQLALRQYGQLRDALRRELDVDPEPDVQKLYQEILTGEIGGAPSLSTEVPASPERVSRSVSPGMLFGRNLEMAQLDQILDQTLVRRGRLVLLSGEAGIGKSRLAAEVRSRAEARGAIALWGAAYQRRREAPYGPFRVAFESFPMRVSPDTLETLLGDSAPALAKLAPIVALTLGLDHSPDVPPMEMDEPEILAGVSHFLVQLSERVPVVIVLEDIQVADEASLGLIEHLATVIQELPVLIVCTFRSNEVISGSRLDRLA